MREEKQRSGETKKARKTLNVEKSPSHRCFDNRNVELWRHYCEVNVVNTLSRTGARLKTCG